jgi:hypothetical protein
MTKTQLHNLLLTYIDNKGAHRNWVEIALTQFPNVLRSLRFAIGDELHAREVYLFLKPNEGLCKQCKKETGFRTFAKGFKPYCSQECFLLHSYGEKRVMKPKVVNPEFDDIEGDQPQPPKVEKKQVSEPIEKPIEKAVKSAVSDSRRTLPIQQEKPTIAAVQDAPKVRQLADLKQFGVRIQHPPRVTPEMWMELKRVKDQVEESHKAADERKARRQQRRAARAQELQEIPKLTELEAQALSILTYEIGIPPHLLQEEPVDITSSGLQGETEAYRYKIVVKSTGNGLPLVVLPVTMKQIDDERACELLKRRASAAEWACYHMLILCLDDYGNVLNANFNGITDKGTTPYTTENMAKLKEIIQVLITGRELKVE